jgi:hypothetical protein
VLFINFRPQGYCLFGLATSERCIACPFYRR